VKEQGKKGRQDKEGQYEEIQGKTEEEIRDKKYEPTERRQVIGLHRHGWVPI
jgi:hypothetical protein